VDEVARTYTRFTDKQTVRIQMFSSPDMAKLQLDSLESLKSPETMKNMRLGHQSMKIAEESGWAVWTLTMGRTSAYRTAVCGSITVCLSAREGDVSLLDVFWKVLDLKALAGKSNAALPAGAGLVLARRGCRVRRQHVGFGGREMPRMLG